MVIQGLTEILFTRAVVDALKKAIQNVFIRVALRLYQGIDKIALVIALYAYLFIKKEEH